VANYSVICQHKVKFFCAKTTFDSKPPKMTVDEIDPWQAKGLVGWIKKNNL
jgi:hypothetical protein